MISRQILTTALAALFLTGAAVMVQAAPMKKPMHHMPMKKHDMMHSKKMMRSRMSARRGGDSQNAAVDQLNAQSLQRASGGGGAMPMATPGAMPMNSSGSMPMNSSSSMPMNSSQPMHNNMPTMPMKQ